MSKKIIAIFSKSDLRNAMTKMLSKGRARVIFELTQPVDLKDETAYTVPRLMEERL